MKILIINSVYETGSTGRIVKCLFNNFNTESDVYLIYGRGKKVSTEHIFKRTIEIESKLHHLCSLVTGNMYGGMFFSTRRIIRLIRKINPDIVNLHCLNGYFVNIYTLLNWLAKKNIKTVLTMHADFMMTGGCGYSIECTKYLNANCKHCEHMKEFNGSLSCNRAFKNFNHLKTVINSFEKSNLKITCVSPWLTNRYKQSPIYCGYDISTIYNPVDPVFFDKGIKNPYSKKRNVLYVTPDIYDPVKTGWQIKDIAKLRPDLNFTIVCSKNINFEFENENITYIRGGADKYKLRDYYYFADATLLLSKRETFSMIVAESLSCGTPVYGFKCGGSESIAINDFSVFVAYGNLNLLADSLLSIKANDYLLSEKALLLYSEKHISNEYLKLFRNLIDIDGKKL